MLLAAREQTFHVWTGKAFHCDNRSGALRAANLIPNSAELGSAPADFLRFQKTEFPALLSDNYKGKSLRVLARETQGPRNFTPEAPSCQSERAFLAPGHFQSCLVGGGSLRCDLELGLNLPSGGTGWGSMYITSLQSGHRGMFSQ